MVNIFPKDITPWSCQDSNPGPSAPDPDALTAIPQLPLLLCTGRGYAAAQLLSLVLSVSLNI